MEWVWIIVAVTCAGAALFIGTVAIMLTMFSSHLSRLEEDDGEVMAG